MSKITFGSNLNSLSIIRQLNGHFQQVSSTLNRLSTGKRINRASDDAAGLAIASTLRASSKVFAQGARNINDGISALNIAEGGLQQLSSVLVRLKELAIQSSNGSFSRTQRLSLQSEANQITAEFNRLGASMRFNGLNLLDGSLNSMRIQSEFGIDGGIAVPVGEELERNVGTGTFTAGATFLPSGIVAAEGGDVDNDGDMDLVVMTDDGFISADILIYRNDGTGTFATVQTITFAGGGLVQIPEMEIADVNGDGNVDITFGMLSTVSTYRGTGGGSFATTAVTATVVGNSAVRVKLGDFNGDGQLDLFAAGSSSQDRYNLLINNGGSFSVAQTGAIDITGGRDEFAVGDLNGDGLAEVVNADPTGFSIFENNNGRLETAINIAGSNTPVAIQIADVNFDGLGDIITGDAGGATIYRNNGGNSFTASSTGLTGGASARIRVGDFNNDGKIDILRGSQNGTTIQIALGNGDGSFSPQSTRTVTATSDFMVGDLNRDGVVDFLSSGSWVTPYLNTANESTSIEMINITTRQDALSALSVIDSAIQRVQSELGAIGAGQSRFSAALAALNAKQDYYDIATSRIDDADVATEAAALVRTQILQNVGSALLAQANQLPQIGLQLLSDL